MPWDELPPLPHPQAAGLAVSVYTPAECEARRQRNLERGKLMPQAYVDATAEELAEICNGIGTDKFGPVVLGVSSGLFRIFPTTRTSTTTGGRSLTTDHGKPGTSPIQTSGIILG